MKFVCLLVAGGRSGLERSAKGWRVSRGSPAHVWSVEWVAFR